MIFDDVLAMRGRLLDTLAVTYPNMVIIFDNQEAATPPVDEVWCRFSVKPNTQQIATIGQTKRYNQAGIATLQIMVPEQMGDAIGYDVLDAWNSSIRDWRSDDSALYVYQTSTQPITPTEDDPSYKINHLSFYRSTRS